VIVFYVTRTETGDADLLYRVVDHEPQQWTRNGWVPAHFDHSGIGGATEYHAISVTEAVDALIAFGAEELNPVR
jgi:hypothetical protein